jgi:hypothetical protein
MLRSPSHGRTGLARLDDRVTPQVGLPVNFTRRAGTRGNADNTASHSRTRPVPH